MVAGCTAGAVAAVGAGATPRRSRLDELADLGGDLLPVALDHGRVVGGEDERGDPVLEGQLGQELGRRVLRAEVEQPPDLAGVAPCCRRRLVDHGVAGRDPLRAVEAAQAGQPAVGHPPDQPQHPRPQRAHPDGDVVRRRRAPLGAHHPVVLPGDPDPTTGLGVPQGPDDLDGLPHRLDRLPRRQTLPAHRLDRVPERSCPERELEAPAAEQVQARRRAGQHGRRPQREVDHVGGQVDSLGAGRGIRHQRPRVEERRLVGVVLERGEVEPGLLAELRQEDGLLRLLGRRGDERAEQQVVAVVAHRSPLPHGPSGRMGPTTLAWRPFHS